jgi:hypothetical protein
VAIEEAQAMEIDVASLLAAVALALVYALRGGAGERGVTRRFWSRRRWISAAAGVSVAYVFVDVLPELAEQNRVIVAAAGSAALFAEQRIYMLALLSFVILYGLQHMVLSSREARRSAVEDGRGRDRVYWLHLAGFALYSALIGYLLVERADRGIAALIVYALAMAIHLLIVNHTLAKEHGGAYRGGGHWWLAAGVIAGWAAGALMPLSDIAFARVFALLAGGVVITSIGAELPGDREGRFWPFCVGAVAFALLLTMA